MAAAVGPTRTLATQAECVEIREVNAYPIYINQRSDGLLNHQPSTTATIAARTPPILPQDTLQRPRVFLDT